VLCYFVGLACGARLFEELADYHASWLRPAASPNMPDSLYRPAVDVAGRAVSPGFASRHAATAAAPGQFDPGFVLPPLWVLRSLDAL